MWNVRVFKNNACLKKQVSRISSPGFVLCKISKVSVSWLYPTEDSIQVSNGFSICVRSNMWNLQNVEDKIIELKGSKNALNSSDDLFLSRFFFLSGVKFGKVLKKTIEFFLTLCKMITLTKVLCKHDPKTNQKTIFLKIKILKV